MRPEELTPRLELFELVKRIPAGRVCAYSACGNALSRRMTGRTVGQCMAQCPDGVPWWRVVSKNGELPIWKRDPVMGQKQEMLLTEDGIEIRDHVVEMRDVVLDPNDIWPPEA